MHLEKYCSNGGYFYLDINVVAHIAQTGMTLTMSALLDSVNPLISVK